MRIAFFLSHFFFVYYELVSSKYSLTVTAQCSEPFVNCTVQVGGNIESFSSSFISFSAEVPFGPGYNQRWKSQRSKTHRLAFRFYKDFPTLELSNRFLSQSPFLFASHKHLTKSIYSFLRGIFNFFQYFIHTPSSAAPQIPLCRRML